MAETITKQKEYSRVLRHRRIRKKLYGTKEQPRLVLHRSLKNLQAQVIVDTESKTLFGLSTLSKGVADQVSNGGNVEGAKAFGKIFAEKALEKGIKKVCFDRGGYIYHGRVKAFADALREGGMEF